MVVVVVCVYKNAYCALDLFYECECLAYMYVYVSHAHEGQTRASNPLEVKLRRVMNCNMVLGSKLVF